MKKIKKAIEVVDVINELYKLQSTLDTLPKLTGDCIHFRIEIPSVGDLICLAEQYKSNFFEPCEMLPYHWCIIEVAENIKLTLETPRTNYKITWE